MASAIRATLGLVDIANPTARALRALELIQGSPGITADLGLLYYYYPKNGNFATDFFEPYFSLSGAVGPVNAKVGVAYAFEGQNALANNDSIYVYGDLTAAVPNTPLTLKAHYGYTDGMLGGLTGEYADYSVGAAATWKALTFGVSYVNTIGFEATPFTKDVRGADGTVVFSVSADF